MPKAPTRQQLEASLLDLQVKVRAEQVDPVKKFLQDKVLSNVQAIQADADNAQVHPVDRFPMRKYLVALAGYTEKQTLEHSGTVQFEPLKISRGDE